MITFSALYQSYLIEKYKIKPQPLANNAVDRLKEEENNKSIPRLEQVLHQLANERGDENVSADTAKPIVAVLHERDAFIRQSLLDYAIDHDNFGTQLYIVVAKLLSASLNQHWLTFLMRLGRYGKLVEIPDNFNFGTHIVVGHGTDIFAVKDLYISAVNAISSQEPSIHFVIPSSDNNYRLSAAEIFQVMYLMANKLPDLRATKQGQAAHCELLKKMLPSVKTLEDFRRIMMCIYSNFDLDFLFGIGNTVILKCVLEAPVQFWYELYKSHPKSAKPEDTLNYGIQMYLLTQIARSMTTVTDLHTAKTLLTEFDYQELTTKHRIILSFSNIEDLCGVMTKNIITHSAINALKIIVEVADFITFSQAWRKACPAESIPSEFINHATQCVKQPEDWQILLSTLSIDAEKNILLSKLRSYIFKLVNFSAAKTDTSVVEVSMLIKTFKAYPDFKFFESGQDISNLFNFNEKINQEIFEVLDQHIEKCLGSKYIDISFLRSLSPTPATLFIDKYIIPKRCNTEENFRRIVRQLTADHIYYVCTVMQNDLPKLIRTNDDLAYLLKVLPPEKRNCINVAALQIPVETNYAGNRHLLSKSCYSAGGDQPERPHKFNP